MLHLLHAQPEWRQPSGAPKAAAGWLRVFDFSRGGIDAAGRGAPMVPGTLSRVAAAAGKALLVNAFGQATTGEIVDGLTNAITLVMIAEKVSSSTANNFLFGEQAPSAAAYSWGFYENSSGEMRGFIHNGTTGVQATDTGGWATGLGIQVWGISYGGGDNNVRLYLNGRQRGSAGQTGNIRRDAGSPLSIATWNTTNPNFRIYAAGVIGRCMSAEEMLEKFKSPQAAWASLFEAGTLLLPGDFAGVGGGARVGLGPALVAGPAGELDQRLAARGVGAPRHVGWGQELGLGDQLHAQRRRLGHGRTVAPGGYPQ